MTRRRTAWFVILAGALGAGLWWLFRRHRDTIKLNAMVVLIIQRGILAPHCGWWRVSDALLEDKSGVHFYKDLRARHGAFVPLNMAGQRMRLITEPHYIRQLLDGSPFPFGVGLFKKRMFQPFMAHNVGVSEGCPWRRRRALNEHVLETHTFNEHTWLPHFVSHIEAAYEQCGTPSDFQGFMALAKTITARIVFGVPHVPEAVFDMFAQANSIVGLLRGERHIESNVRRAYERTLRDAMQRPVPGSLVAQCMNVMRAYGLTHEEVHHQIPHFIFPIGGLVHTNLPRTLVLLANHAHVLDAVRAGRMPLRHVVLETLRLNNPVVTLFRTLRRDYAFDATHRFEAGTAFVVLTNPVLSDAATFPHPNQFHPTRWSTSNELERRTESIMFSHGPQRCPGKSLALSLLSACVRIYLRRCGILAGTHQLKSNTTLNPKALPQMLNVCNVRLYSVPTIATDRHARTI